MNSTNRKSLWQSRQMVQACIITLCTGLTSSVAFGNGTDTVPAQQVCTPAELEERLTAYVLGARALCDELNYIQKAPYETETQFALRIQAHERALRRRLTEYYQNSGVGLVATLPVRSVHFDFQKEQARLGLPTLSIGDNARAVLKDFPGILYYTEPILHFSAGSLRFSKVPIPLAPTEAQIHDITNYPGKLMLRFRLDFSDANAFGGVTEPQLDLPLAPALRLLSAEWRTQGEVAHTLWAWNETATLYRPSGQTAPGILNPDPEVQRDRQTPMQQEEETAKTMPAVLTNSIGMKLNLIKPGSFEADWTDGTVHCRIRVTHSFYIGVFEVTQEEYVQVMGDNPAEFKGPRYPVEQVTWDNARTFCRKLSEQENRPYRLPTEAEWEYACRAGTPTDYFWGDKFESSFAWTQQNSGRTVHEVGTRLANAWGLYDMSGNVSEWCEDWFGVPPPLAWINWKIRKGHRPVWPGWCAAAPGITIRCTAAPDIAISLCLRPTAMVSAFVWSWPLNRLFRKSPPLARVGAPGAPGQ